MDPATPITVSLSPDAMTAVLELPDKFTGDLSRENLADAFSRAGIKEPPEDEMLDGLISAYAQGMKISGRVIARGVAPTPPRAQQIKLSGDPSFPVFPGDVFAELEPGWPGTPGKNLLGEVIEPEEAKSGALPKITPDSGVTRVGDQYFALRHGLVRMDEQRVLVEEIFNLTPDRSELRGVVFHRDYAGKTVTVRRLREAMLAMHVTLPPCLLFVERALTEAQLNDEAQPDVLIACAINPRPGQDGYLDLRIKDNRSATGITDARGRIDYRQRGRLPTVEKGALVAALVDPTLGHPGRTMDNEYIPTTPGQELYVEAGANVRLAEDGHSYYAENSGLLLLQDDVLSVSEVYYVEGDVDMRIGHVEMERGSIHIKGSVLAGFRLNCPGSIVVEGTVEDSKITAGGDIEIAGGLVMAGTGMVKAGGNVISLFASKARIDAEGDISVVNEMLNCNVLADGHVLVTGGNSKIIGGVIQAGEGISALEVGTQLGSRTIIHLGLDEGFLYKKNQEATRLRSSLRKLEAQLGPGSNLDIINRFPEDRQDDIAKLIHSRGLLSGHLTRLEERIVRCQEKIERQEACILKVLGTIHPGTVIHCRGKNMTVRSPLEFSQISFDHRKRQFRVSQLQSPVGARGRSLN